VQESAYDPVVHAENQRRAEQRTDEYWARRGSTARAGALQITQDDYVSAGIAAQYFVKQQLLCPRTAKFQDGWLRGEQRFYVIDGGQRCKIMGRVDAQNAFGAMMRSNYQVVLRRVKAGSSLDCWEPVDISVSP